MTDIVGTTKRRKRTCAAPALLPDRPMWCMAHNRGSMAALGDVQTVADVNMHLCIYRGVE